MVVNFKLNGEKLRAERIIKSEKNPSYGGQFLESDFDKVYKINREKEKKQLYMRLVGGFRAMKKESLNGFKKLSKKQQEELVFQRKYPFDNNSFLWYGGSIEDFDCRSSFFNSFPFCI